MSKTSNYINYQPITKIEYSSCFNSHNDKVSIKSLNNTILYHKSLATRLTTNFKLRGYHYNNTFSNVLILPDLGKSIATAVWQNYLAN